MIFKYINSLNKYVFLYQRVYDKLNDRYGFIKHIDIHGISSLLILFDDKNKKIYTSKSYNELSFIF